MSMTWVARLFPYFIVEKAGFGTTSVHASLRFSEDVGDSVDVYEIDAGVWVVKSSRAELLHTRAKLNRLIAGIDARLGDVS